MTEEERMKRKAMKTLRECVESIDPKQAHEDADKVLCDVLRFLGYGKLVALWKKVGKWYA